MVIEIINIIKLNKQDNLKKFDNKVTKLHLIIYNLP